MPVELPQGIRAAIDTTYRNVVFPYLVRGGGVEDREIPHERSIQLLQLADNPSAKAVLHELFAYEDPMLETTFAGIELKNPLNMPAGFDKDAKVYKVLGRGMGYGSVTVGTVTKIPYEGNPRPRIFAPTKEQVIINRMGFPGEGVDEVEPRLEARVKASNDVVLFVNIGASRPSFEQGTAVEDYTYVARRLARYGSMHEVNVSSPNTEGVRGLQEVEVFKDLAEAVSEAYSAENTPFMFKFSPDLPKHQLEELLRISVDVGSSGVVLANTSTDASLKANLEPRYAQEVGGLSGSLLNSKSAQVSHDAYSYLGETLPILTEGGINTPEDIWRALTYRGGQLVGIYSAFVRKETSGPNFVHDRLKGLAKAMKKKGMTSMQDFKDLRGKEVPFPRRGVIF